MDNTTLQEMLDTFGLRIFSIKLDNDRHILLGYVDGPKLEDVELETIGDVDFIKLKNYNRNNGKTITYVTYHLTKQIQSIGVMDENDVDFRVDPFTIR